MGGFSHRIQNLQFFSAVQRIPPGVVTSPTLLVSVRGQGGIPPMPGFALGPDHAVAITRSSFNRSLYVVYTREPWRQVKASFLTQFHRSNTPCRTGPFVGSGYTLYDHLADRWLIYEVALVSGRSYLCLLVSLSKVPYGLLYRGWSIELPTATPGDVVAGIMPDAYYLSTTGEGVATAYAIDRANLLAGSAQRPLVRVTAPALAGFQRQGFMPSHMHGLVRTSAPCGLFIRQVDDEAHNPANSNASQDYLELWQLCANFGGTSNWTQVASLPISEFDANVCSLSANVPCFSQPAPSATQLIPYQELPQPQLAYRSYGTHDAMLTSFTTNVGANQGGVRWVELRRDAAGSPWRIHQDGLHSPNIRSRFLSSAALDATGNMALGYSVVDTASVTYPSVYYTGREAGAPLGTMTAAETLVTAGTRASTAAAFGGRSVMVPDPRDGCTFALMAPWETAASRSALYLAMFRFPDCGECSTDVDCNDGQYCTLDKCRDGECFSEVDPLLCRYGDYCSEALDACVSCLANANCSNGLFCDGEELCNATGQCVPAASPPCLEDRCREDDDKCLQCLVPADCDNGVFCDGTETCTGDVCVAGAPPCPVGSTCNEGTDSCEGELSDPLAGLSVPLLGARPPNPSLAVGLDHLIVVASTSNNIGTYYVYGKASLESSPPPLRSTYIGSTQTSSPCRSGVSRSGPFVTSPSVLYDHQADRWLMAEVGQATGGPYTLCLAFSITGDAALTLWRTYMVNLTTATAPVSITLAFMPYDGYYLATGGSPPEVYALDRASMLVYQELRPLVVYQAPPLAGYSVQGLVPAALDGPMPILPPCALFLRQVDAQIAGTTSDTLEIWRFCPNFATTNSTFEKVQELPISSFDSALCGGGATTGCFSQNGSAVTLAAFAHRLSPRVVFRSRTSYDVLVLAFTVDVGGDQGAIRWLELRKQDRLSTNTWSVFQEGTYGGEDTFNRWLPSIGVDMDQGIMVGFSKVSASSYPALAYAGRAVGDPSGTLPHAEKTLKAGTRSDPSALFGGQSSLVVDPVDGCTMYYAGQYDAVATSAALWLGMFKSLACAGECAKDADCPPDTLFCTEARCRDGICSQVLGSTCPLGQTCLEDTDTCVDCVIDAQCSNGQFCDGEEVCADGNVCAAGTDPCPGSTCNEDLNECVAA
eukprot:jgi/Mesvir1/24778/Mv22032-RA.2